MKIAAIGDLHCRADSGQAVQEILDEAVDHADVLVLAGDLTDTGLPTEAESLVEVLKDFPLPKIAVLGNHDHESDQAEEITRMLLSVGVCVLDGTVTEIGDVGFVGTKGFCGGFDDRLVQPFGERALKTFINTSIEESIRLENALAKLDCPHKVAILHYAPIKATLEGESPELYPFLGSGRLANAIDRRGVDAIVHGHAHHGSPYGRTAGNIPVYNVCRFVQKTHSGSHICIFEI
jgi:Icc-related predicted phosphoesterase